ncbi:Gfo/Idh/MocA family protein [Streptomyces sp. CB02613]|uniref:Gfo/Idh/MocA family protein n=1 Tax=Streptomyces sp. CB02613 TaxID=2020328 RepID=UPI001F2F59A5|nr:Gfo/Idh/MocA family oxidoreductase [Streptomyces sp. CB02613]
MTERRRTAGRLRVGVLGCADIARRRMLPALVRSTDAELIAVAGRDPAKTRRFTDFFGGVPVDGYERLLERADVDAVYVPQPTGLHAHWAERALRAGKHVLVEKPLAPTEREADRLVRLAASLGLALLENFMFLGHAQHTLARGLLADGAIGELREISAEFGVPPRPDGDIRLQHVLGGGALNDVGCYPLRTALLHLGPDARVVGASLRYDGGVDRGGAALLDAPSGATARLGFGMDRSYTASCVLWGSTGRITLPRAYTPPPDRPALVRWEGRGGLRELSVPPQDQFATVLTSWADRVRNGVPSPLEGEPVVRLAALLDQVRHRSPIPGAAPSVPATEGVL